MNNKQFNINCYLIILANNIESEDSYIYSLSESKIELPYISLDDKNYNNIIYYIKEYIHSIMRISELDISINLISLNSQEICEYSKSNKDTICSLYGIEIPTNIYLSSGYWRKFSILENNDGINYPISLVMQRCLL